jgi:hypothetical protein
MPIVEVPLPVISATINAELRDGSGNLPANVIHEDDDAEVRAEVELTGIGWDWAEFGLEFVLRIEGNPRLVGGLGANIVLGPRKVMHNGNPGGAPYTIDTAIPIPAGTLVVTPPEKAQSYEFTLEVVAVDDASGDPHGMAGFVDLGEVMVYAAP